VANKNSYGNKAFRMAINFRNTGKKSTEVEITTKQVMNWTRN
jgi:hypothetical protein